ncbi:hypothetical protein D8T25_10010 [Vibrio vulnificus]|nr:hypothetical protein D8T25_10010 [Vibrio vulnificus]
MVNLCSGDVLYNYLVVCLLFCNMWPVFFFLFSDLCFKLPLKLTVLITNLHKNVIETDFMKPIDNMWLKS